MNWRRIIQSKKGIRTFNSLYFKVKWLKILRMSARYSRILALSPPASRVSIIIRTSIRTAASRRVTARERKRPTATVFTREDEIAVSIIQSTICSVTFLRNGVWLEVCVLP